ncbi:MAG: hypothetical protein R6X32_12790 [Chloroflexota bacterium]
MKEKLVVALLFAGVLVFTMMLVIGFFVLWHRLIRNAYPLPNRVETKRFPAQATIEKVWDTGVTLNHDPQVGLRLAIQPARGPAYRLETKVIISQATAARLRPGTALPVTIRHDDPTDIVLEPVSSNPLTDKRSSL